MTPEERREKFRAAKKKAGGFQALMREIETAPYKLYYTDDGAITCVTNNPEFTPHDDWHTYDFTQEQLKIVVDNDAKNYVVVTDDKDASIRRIELRDQNDDIATYSALQEITAPLRYVIVNNYLTIDISDKLKEQYADVDATTAVFNGRRNIKIYIAPANDPHFLLESVIVDMREILDNNQIVRKLKDDYTDAAAYIFT